MGMLPNRFPDEGQAPEYNTVDATLWYFEAIRAYHEATGDQALLRDLFPVLQDIIDWHVRGTRYQIHVDPADGQLYAGEPGVQLTWMDAKVDDWVVTPRIGKPVEVNALWYNALCIMSEFARLLGESPERYEALAEQVRAGFARFWNEEAGYCYDVLEAPEARALAAAGQKDPGGGGELADQVDVPSAVRAGSTDPLLAPPGISQWPASTHAPRPAQPCAWASGIARPLRRRPQDPGWSLPPGDRIGLADRAVRQRTPAAVP
jgi:glycogen debranching enzyme